MVCICPVCPPCSVAELKIMHCQIYWPISVYGQTQYNLVGQNVLYIFNGGHWQFVKMLLFLINGWWQPSSKFDILNSAVEMFVAEIFHYNILCDSQLTWIDTLKN